MFTRAESDQAAQSGWQLCQVVDAGTQKMHLAILPMDFSKTSSAAAMDYVTQKAKNGDALAVKALTLIARENIQNK